MRSPVEPSPRGGRAALLALACSLGLLCACNDQGNRTNIINNNGLDCGLVRDDLIGTWKVTIAAGTVGLINCTGPGSPGSVTSSGLPLTYNNVTVTANTTASAIETGVGYQVVGAGTTRTDELIANVEADSCLAQFQVWISGDKTYIQCIGGLNRTTRAISGFCDSAEFPSSGVATDPIDTFCSLNANPSGSVQIL